MSRPHTIITIDGPAGVGKSTLAKAVAARTGLPYLDTGAMFRCLALKLGADAPALDEDTVRARCAQWDFSLRVDENGNSVLLCGTTPVGQEIRTETVGMMAAKVAAMPVVRQYLKTAQQRIGTHTSLVAEGRDMGTEIFPDAPCKFFLDASAAVRATRRYNDLRAQEHQPLPSLEELTAQIQERDKMDRNRPIAPLRPAPDAMVIDTSALTVDQVLQTMLARINALCV